MQPVVISCLLMATILLAIRIEESYWLFWPLALSFSALWMQPKSKDTVHKQTFFESLPPWIQNTTKIVAPLVIAAIISTIISYLGGSDAHIETEHFDSRIPSDFGDNFEDGSTDEWGHSSEMD